MPAGIQLAMRRDRTTLLGRAWPLALLLVAAGLIALVVTNRDEVAGPGPFLAVLAGPEALERPELVGATVSGESFDVESLRGRPVLINVWASW